MSIIKINGKEYNDPLALVAATIITLATFVFVGAILLGVAIMLLAPILIPFGAGVFLINLLIK